MVSGNATVTLVYQHSTSKPKMVEETMEGGVGRPGSLDDNLMRANKKSLYSLHMPESPAQTLRLFPLG